MKARTARALIAIFFLLNIAYIFEGLQTAEYEEPVTTYSSTVSYRDNSFSLTKVAKPLWFILFVVLPYYKWRTVIVIYILLTSQVYRNRTDPNNWQINIRSPNAAVQGGFLFWRDLHGGQNP